MNIWNGMAADYPLSPDRPSTVTAVAMIRRTVGSGQAAADIGCGPGNQSIPLAGIFGRVYSVDSSPRMLDRLRHECSERGITNVHPVESDCLDAVLPERCDLAFSCLCPGMYSRRGLEKLEELSDRYCMFMAGTCDRDSTEMRILDEAGIRFRKWFDAMDLYDILSETRDVKVRLVSDPMQWSDREGPIRRCIRMSDGSAESERLIREYFERNDPSDMEFRRSMAILCWEI